ncbi:Bug family tripartite tricarboxylate transporter substrate binding protein [Variovorax ginsengisoli]|uniref:Tripartite-type tricarboxylate transporter receptor subunit TctC n=1 Tax=Variovorax ginsengisoli TaxID=363844 RepID=A0ABT9S772_9BURK|nr:tripartite tricarboxylate transporter substrate binding protein [Variovorax ginsengisoli]MDP9899182.1 tripartite-type tricarboxylate transporter receptor subunit TctC [Variovorax ginsengisoli]
MNWKISRRALIAAACVGACAAIAAQGAGAQTIPRTIRIIVAYPAGGVSDVVARGLADKLTQQLGSTVIVENRAGASGTIGVDAVAKAQPDGATLGFAAISPLVLSPHLGRLPYDPFKDIAPVASVMYSPVLLLATSATGTRDFRSLLADAKARPGDIRWATSGPASLGHIILEQLRADTGVDITHVPYKGGGQQMTDAISGQFEILSTNAAPPVSAQIKTGKLRPLAVGAPARLEGMPNVPTLTELGFRSASLSSQFGVIAPAGTPLALLGRYNDEINKALASPDLRARLIATDNVPTGGSASDFAKEIRSEYDAMGRIVREANIKAD